MPDPCIYFCMIEVPKKPRNRGRKDRRRREFVPVDPVPIETWFKSLLVDLKKEFLGLYIHRPPAPISHKEDWIEEHGGQRAWFRYLYLGVSFTGESDPRNIWEMEGTWPPR